jgi:EmrB/QacA subfamily drug resistance transporter
VSRRLVSEANRKWWTLGALCFSLFMIMLDNTVVNVALPAIQKDLRIGLSQLEWTINAYTLSFAVLLLMGGKLADFVGRKRVLLVGLVIFTIASLVCGLATTGGTLIAARAVQGLGAALMMPSTLSIIPATFPPRERGTAVGIWAGVSLLALAIGPLVGGLLVEHISWNWIFYVNVPVGAIGFVVATLVIRESRDSSAEQRLDLPGLLASGIALFALTFALVQANSYGWGSPQIVGCFVLSALGFAAFAAVERRSRLAMLDLSLFRNPTFSGANVVALLVLFIVFGIFFFMSIFTQGVLHYSAVETGASFLPMTVVLVAVTPFAAKASVRFGCRWLMTSGMALLGVALLLLSGLDAHSAFWDMVPGYVLGGVGVGLTMTPMTIAVLGSVPVEKSGVASGVLNSFRQVGGALGVAVLGAIVAAQIHGLKPIDPRFGPAFVDGFQRALVVAAVVSFAGAIVAALLVGDYRRLAAHEVAEVGA